MLFPCVRPVSRNRARKLRSFLRRGSANLLYASLELPANIQMILISNTCVSRRGNPTFGLSKEVRASLCAHVIACLLLFCCWFQCLPPVAQAGESSHFPTFHIDAPAVLVPTTVLDRRGALASGLPALAFLVSQDHVPQRITSFGEQDLPVSTGIVFDTSGSMRSVLGQSQKRTAILPRRIESGR